MVQDMKRRLPNSRTLLCGLLLCLAAPTPLTAEPPPAAGSAFNTCIAALESRLAHQHSSQTTFLVSPQNDPRLRRGELIVEQLTPAAATPIPGALLHHWRATAFAPGAKATDFERLMKDINAYPQHFSPQVLQAKLLTEHDNRLQASMRVRQRHIITVVMDSTYNITFAQLDPQHGYSLSQSTRISEIDSPGTPTEHALTSSEEHGFLWRLNTYWSYEERDGGLYMQVESVSLTRSIPRGLGWVVGPFVESVPRDSLEFTLRSTCNALRK
jgi:hypothetical protein